MGRRQPGDLLTVNIDQIPLLKDAMGPGIHIQPLRLDPEKGQVVLIATMAPDDQQAAPTSTWAAAAMIALTVRRQRPQSAPAPHASATSLEVHAPPATTSATT